MNLRRVADTLRAHDWTAIAIEFVLVVLGVLLGIQAQNWQGDLANPRLVPSDIGRNNKSLLDGLDAIGKEAP